MNCHEFLEQVDRLLDYDAGRGGLSADRANALREHRDSCSLCRWEMRRDESLATALRALPAEPLPERTARAIRDVAKHGAKESGGDAREHGEGHEPVVAAEAASSVWDGGARVIPGWVVWIGAAAATILVVLAIRGGGPSYRGLPGSDGIEAWRDGAWVATVGHPIRFGESLRTADEAVPMRLSDAVTVELGPASRFAVLDDATLRLDGGRVGAWVRPGEPMRVATGDVSVESRGTVFSVSSEETRLDGEGGVDANDSGGPGFAEAQKDRGMRIRPKDAAIAGVVTVAVAAGTVRVTSSYGTLDVNENEVARVLPGGAPTFVDLAATESELRDTVRRLETEIAALRDELATEREENEARRASAVAAPESASTPREPKLTAESKLTADELRERYDRLIEVYGYGSYLNPGFSEFASLVRAAGDAGIGFVLDELDGADTPRLFSTLLLASRIGDDRLLDDVADLASGHDELIIRRAATRALAAIEDPRSEPALLSIYRSGEDAGVLLNAWYGLARLGNEEAFTTVRRLLDSASSEVTEDVLLANVLLFEDPRLDVGLREAFHRTGLSVAKRRQILEALSDSPDDRWHDFFAEVANDPFTEEELRDVARRQLGP